MIVIIVSFFGSPPIEEGFETRHKKKKKCRPKKPTHLPTPNPTEAPTNPPTVSPTEPPTEKPKCTKSPRRTIVIEKEIKKSCPKNAEDLNAENTYHLMKRTINLIVSPFI